MGLDAGSISLGSPRPTSENWVLKQDSLALGADAEPKRIGS